jgi:hypothetical protein
MREEANRKIVFETPDRVPKTRGHVLTLKFGKLMNFAINLPICQNYVEISLFWTRLRTRQSKSWKVHEIMRS